MSCSETVDRALRRRNRRQVLTGLGAAVAATALPACAWATPGAPVRFGTTAVFRHEQVGLLEQWQRYLERRLGAPVRFVQRGRYREIVDLLLGDGVEAAWLCGHPLLLYESRLSVVAVPRYEGEPLYRSHLIVPESDRTTSRVGDLRGRVFAYSDPLSNSGYLVPRAEIAAHGADPDGFFRRTFFTYSHRNVIEAVRTGLADGGAVDGYVWDTIRAQQPANAAGLRVAWRSTPHGFPPVVVRRTWSEPQQRRLAAALHDMTASDDGRLVLQRLNLDAFDAPRPGQFDSIRPLLRLSGTART